jgi:hypothetical protein
MRLIGAEVNLPAMREAWVSAPLSDDAVKRCALGALVASAYGITGGQRMAYDLAIRAIQPLYGTATLVKVNDVRGHAAVLALFDEVIAAG